MAHSPPAVVLVRPREEGNVGAAARAMANMGLSRLIVVEPAAPFGKVAEMFAVGARHILASAVRVADLRTALAPFRRIAATTSTRDRTLSVPLLSPRELPAWLAAAGAGQLPPGPPGTAAAALVFGPEVGGLTNEDLALAGAVVTIPCSPVQPTLNLSQAVLILAYELFLAREDGLGLPASAALAASAASADPAAEPPATAAELDGLLSHLREVLTRVGFARDESFPGVLTDLRQLAARAAPGSREVRILRGICRRTLGALARAGAGDG
jgi:TrmH family RNA methyltransferase